MCLQLEESISYCCVLIFSVLKMSMLVTLMHANERPCDLAAQACLQQTPP